MTIQLRNERLVSEREKRGMSQMDVSKATGLPLYVVSSLELMKRRPRNVDGSFIDSVYLLASFYDVDEWELFPEDLDKIKVSRIQKKFDIANLQFAYQQQQAQLMWADPVKRTQNVEYKNTIRNAISCLSPVLQDVIKRRFGIDCDEQTLDEVAKDLNLSKARIIQLEAKALRRMRHPSISDQIRDIER